MQQFGINCAMPDPTAKSNSSLPVVSIESEYFVQFQPLSDAPHHIRKFSNLNVYYAVIQNGMLIDTYKHRTCYYQHQEDAMGKFNKHQSDRERFGRCEICMEYIPVEYYFSEGDQITCYECGTEYTLLSKSPVKLAMLDSYGGDDYFGEMEFDD